MTNLNLLSYLWSEYQYRHDLVWRTLLRLGFVVAFLSAIPYMKDTLTQKLLYFMAFPPFLAVVVALFGFKVIQNELHLLSNIRITYRRLQNDLFKEIQTDISDDCIFQHDLTKQKPQEPFKGDFGQFLLLYLFTLIGLGLANFIFISFFWIEKVKT